MKVAIVHDQLVKPGGAEKVLETLLKIFKGADIFTITYFPEYYKKSIISKHVIFTSYLDKYIRSIRMLPKGNSIYRLLFFKFPEAIESFDLRPYDLIISSHAIVSNGVITYPNQLHIGYIHTPIRAIWSAYQVYLDKFPKIAKTWALKQFNRYRIWDYVAAQRPDYILVNSNTIKKRVYKYYRRKADAILFPPVEVRKIQNVTKNIEKTNEFYFAISRLQEYKRFDLIVNAFKHLRDKQVYIAGTGPELQTLQKLAKGVHNIKFLGYISDEEKYILYRQAKALIFPAYEDFGIVPVEAQAAGTPVIAFGQGGVLDTVIPGETGIFFKEQNEKSLIDAIYQFEHMNFNETKIMRHAEKFAEEVFINNMKKHINAWLETKS